MNKMYYFRPKRQFLPLNENVCIQFEISHCSRIFLHRHCWWQISSTFQRYMAVCIVVGSDYRRIADLLWAPSFLPSYTLPFEQIQKEIHLAILAYISRFVKIHFDIWQTHLDIWANTFFAHLPHLLSLLLRWTLTQSFSHSESFSFRILLSRNPHRHCLGTTSCLLHNCKTQIRELTRKSSSATAADAPEWRKGSDQFVEPKATHGPFQTFWKVLRKLEISDLVDTQLSSRVAKTHFQK